MVTWYTEWEHKESREQLKLKLHKLIALELETPSVLSKTFQNGSAANGECEYISKLKILIFSKPHKHFFRGLFQNNKLANMMLFCFSCPQKARL